MADGTYYGKVVDDEIFLEENSNVGEYIPISELTKDFYISGRKAYDIYKCNGRNHYIYL